MFMVLDNNFNKLGALSGFKSMRWISRHTRAGEYELKVEDNPHLFALLKEGKYIFPRGGTELAEIEYPHIDSQESTEAIIKGRFVLGYARQRIIRGREVLNGSLEACVGQLLQNHLIAPGDPARRIPAVAYQSVPTGIMILAERSYRNIEDTITDFCEAHEVGIRADFNIKTKIITVRLCKGVVRPVIFSRERGNIMGYSYDKSAWDYATAALIGGEGEGAARVLTDVGGGSGVDRREIFVDASDLRIEDFPAGQYVDALKNHGHEKLQERSIVESFDALAHQHGSVKYGQDYHLGDIVRVRDRDLGIEMQTYVAEAATTYDADGESVDVKFGQPLPTLADKLKNKDN